jgi:preprotein translocase subunit SecG
MSYVIGVLTVIMVFTCVLLILLVLIQLPKKEAGAGLAFGGGTTDALFGAGSGNVLTKVTKYAIGVAFVLWMLLGGLQSHYFHKEVTGLEENYGHQPAMPAAAPAPYSPATAPAAAAPSGTNSFLLTPPPAAPATSAAPASVPAK